MRLPDIETESVAPCSPTSDPAHKVCFAIAIEAETVRIARGETIRGSMQLIPSTPSENVKRASMRSDEVIIVSVATMLASAPAAHAEDRPTLRLGLGGGRVDIDTNDVELDDSTIGVELFVGVELNSYFAIEGGYLYGGTVEEESVAILDDTRALYVSAIGSFPLDDDVFVYARTGWLELESDREIRVDGDAVNVENADDSGPLFGAGVATLIENALVRVEYRMGDLDDTDLRLLSLAVTWRF